MALCIRHWDWSETSQTVSLFTRGHGLVRAIAKGAKRPNAPFSGGLELLTLGEAGLVIKPASDLALLTEWDLQEIFPSLRTSLPRQHAALYIADLLQRLVTDRDPHTDLFDAALAALRAVHGGQTDRALLQFQLAALTATGYRPVLDRDIRTGESLPAAARLVFSPTLGGAAAERESDDRSGWWRVRGSTLIAISAVDNPGASPPHSEDIARANRLLAAYIRHLLGAEPPTLRLVFPDLHTIPVFSRERS